MSAYTATLDNVVHKRGIRYVLTSPLVWHIGAEHGPVYIVPKGFEFDVSIPRPFWFLFNPHDPRYFKAAALHDHMLISGWSRITAAAEFHNALKADGVPLWRRLVMFLAVSLWKYS
jgi:Protein of unknown function (DUF1353).